MENPRPSVVDSFIADQLTASMGPRFVAWLIDSLLVNAISFATSYTLNIDFFGVSATLWSLIVGFAYAGSLTSQKGATFGKQWMKIRIVNSKTGQTPDFVTAGLRDSLGHLVSGLILMIGYLCAFFTENHVAFHDVVFKTRVVRARQEIHL